ncbi:U2-type spliceosomal complex subunit CWC21 [Aspergillus chevalieri]|uniref:RNA-splicing factor n=1 Tax=Aspergillus chevalieri TaxID=182096 RepID=A0A7R7ZNK3_ASPCH|nr:RNA-splicing factor [Aspergillus chevalieri]BCR88970.1 RNA-splicing factor [Aspergillus chevalieri]
MSSNVGLSTPRGSGTSGYVQRNHAFIKPRNAGYGAPYPPVADDKLGGGFKQRQPDRKILEHDRLRGIEVRVMEERERLEEENERVEEELSKTKGKGKKGKHDEEEKEEGETSKNENENEKRVLSDEEIDERCESLRQKLLQELDDEANAPSDSRRDNRGRRAAPKEKKQFKAYQVHELAEAKIEESERLRKALGIREDRETGEISSGWRDARR